MEQSPALETLRHWVCDHSDTFHDRLYDLIQAADADQLESIKPIFGNEIAALKKFKEHDFKKLGVFWDYVGIRLHTDGYIKLENERTFLPNFLFEPCCRCPHCKEDFQWDAITDLYPYFITKCCGYQYRAAPLKLFLEIEKID